MIPEKKDDKWRLFIKFVFVLLCCTAGAGFTATSVSPYEGANNSVSSSPVALLGIFLLATLLLAAMGLRVRGKTSESWAVLAYGSWMAIPCLMFFYLLSYGQDRIAASWLWYLIEGAILAFLVHSGIRSALRGQWISVGIWWLSSWVLLPFLFTQWMYAQYYLQEEQEAPPAVVTPATKTIPLPDVS